MISYRTPLFDNARWEGFEFRPGDIVISTPAKCGTTWTQILCALLIFDTAELPAPLDELSPWLDMCNDSIENVRATLAAQTHRRFIKTHTPLDGLPWRHDVTYVVVGRDPRDVAVSHEHHRDNMDLDRFFEHRAAAMGLDDMTDFEPRIPDSDDPALRFRAFVDAQPDGHTSLAGVLHHLDTAWQRRREANVTMFHYSDYTADLVGEMLKLAAACGVATNAARVVELAPAASIDAMRANSDRLAPTSRHSVFRDPAAFFRSGGFGEWRDRVGPETAAHYEARVGELVGPELAAWTHNGRIASGIDPEA